MFLKKKQHFAQKDEKITFFKDYNMHKQCFYRLFLLLFCLCFDPDILYIFRNCVISLTKMTKVWGVEKAVSQGVG